MLRMRAERSQVGIVGDQVGCSAYAQDIAKAIMTILEWLKSKEVTSCLYHFSGNVCCSWTEFSQAICDESLELKVILSKPTVIAIITKKIPTLAKWTAQSQLNSNKITANFGINSSDYMFGIRLSRTAIKNESH